MNVVAYLVAVGWQSSSGRAVARLAIAVSAALMAAVVFRRQKDLVPRHGSSRFRTQQAPHLDRRAR